MATKKEQYPIPQEYQLSEKEQTEILKKSKFSFLVESATTEQTTALPISRAYHCFCSGEDIVSPVGMVCKYCGQAKYKHRLATKSLSEYWDRRNNVTSPKTYKDVEKSTIYYVKKSSFDAGILFIKAQIVTTLIDNQAPTTIVIPSEVVDIRPGESQKAYRLSKTNQKMSEIDKENVINLNSQTIKHVDIIYKDANTMLDFLIKNPKFAKYTGIMNCYVNTTIGLEQNSFFLAYLSLYTYECIEFIAKMGHYSLLNSILEKIKYKQNRETISSMLSNLAHFINKDATNGSSAFNFPKYIADYLRDTERPVEQYLFWADIYSRENISYENFQKVLDCNSFHSTAVMWTHKKLYEILLFDYKLLDVLKYLDKEDAKRKDTDHESIVLFADYLAMCANLQIEYDKFPTNLMEAHDNLATICASQKYDIENNKIKAVHNAIMSYVDQDVLENEEYVILIPSSSKEIIEESQLQHNCVASYIPRIASEETLVFFIRKKNEQNTPYITAEYKLGRIVQIKYKYNATVFDKNILDFANRFAEKLVSKSPRHNGDLKEMIRKATK